MGRLDNLEFANIKSITMKPVSTHHFASLPGRIDDEWQWLFNDFDRYMSKVAQEAIVYLEFRNKFETYADEEYLQSVAHAMPTLFGVMCELAEGFYFIDQETDRVKSLT